MFGSAGLLIALIVLTMGLAAAFLVRSSITVGVAGKILAFVGLCVLPVLCIGGGMSAQIERSKQTRFCVACHESHGESLYIADPSYIPAQHFQNHLVPPSQACYTCHTDYAIYGSLEDKITGLRNILIEYVSTPPKVMHISGGYKNMECLHCHADARGFSDNPTHAAIMGSLTMNRISCITCHDMIHNVSEVGRLKMWVEGNAPISPPSGPSSPAPAKAETGATAGAPKAPAAGPAGGAAATQGKSIFDSQRCSGCHGQSGVGGVGPALTHISTQYPPAKLTAVLKAPTAKMKAAGMVPLTLNSADMKALVSYVTSLGGTSAAPAATPPASGSSSPAPAKAAPTATAAPSKAAPVATPPASGSPSPAPAKAEPSAAAGPGKGIFDSHGCGGCHGESGGGGSGPPLTHISSQYPPAKLTALLKAPTDKMKAAGMVALTLDSADMEALVSYLASLGGTSAAPAATPTASGPSSPAPAKAEPGATAAPSKAAAAAPPASGPSPPAPAKAEPTATAGPPTAESKGKAIFKAYGCADCHGTDGVAGTAAAPALAGTGKNYAPAPLTAMLKHPTADMLHGGMPPVSMGDDELKALVAYVSSISASKSAPH